MLLAAKNEEQEEDRRVLSPSTYKYLQKRGFIAKRHDNIKDFLTILLNKVCHDVQFQPQLIPVTNEHMRIRTANTNYQLPEQQKNRKHLPAIFRKYENSKKREYIERVTEIELGTSLYLEQIEEQNA